MEDEVIELNDIPLDAYGIWEKRFKQLQNDKGLALYPDTPEQINSLRRNVYGAAKRRNIPIKTRIVTTNGVIRLYIWLA